MLKVRAILLSPSFQALGAPQWAFYTNSMKCLPPCNTKQTSLDTWSWVTSQSDQPYPVTSSCSGTQTALYVVLGKVLVFLTG